MALQTVVILVSMVTCITALPANNETLKFVAKDWEIFPGYRMKSVFRDVPVVFDCSTNDPQADVKLLQKKFNGVYIDAVTEKQPRLTQEGQKFKLDAAQSVDRATYQCSASNDRDGEIEMLLGDLNLLPYGIKDEIEIFPYPTGGKIGFDKGSTAKLACKSSGPKGTTNNFLKWLRLVNGQPQELSNVVHTDEQIGTTAVDVAELTLKDFQLKDEGLYMCQRSLTNVYVHYKNITLFMKKPVKPTVAFPTHPSGFLSKPSGSYIAIYCQVIGSPVPDRYWKRNNQIIQKCPEDYTNNCYLVISKSKWTDSGDYYCGGKNEVDEVTKIFTLEITTPPVLEKPSHTIASIYEENKELICNVQVASPQPTIVWESQVDTCEPSDTNCKPLDSEWKEVSQQTPGKTDPTMTSKTASKATQKNYFYRCIATNKVGSDTYNFKVIRTAKSEAQFSFYAEKNPINENSRLNLTCLIDETKFKVPTILKVGSSTPLKVQEYEDELQDNIKTYVYWKSVSELSDDGTYVCQAQQQRGTNVSKSSVDIVIKALLAPSIQNFKDMRVSQDNNRNLKIDCKVTGNPPPTITWQHNSRSLDEIPKIGDENDCDRLYDGIYRKSEDVLIICGLNYEKHSGEFKCTAKNTLKTVSKTLKLAVYAKPQIDNLASEKTYGIGDGAEVYCNTLAYPPANVSWYRINDDNSTTEITFGTLKVGVLTFPKLKRENTGLYKCVATNVHGKASENIRIFVKGTTGASMGESQKSTIIGIVVAFVVLLIIIIIFVLWYRRHLKKHYAKYLEPNEDFILDPDRSLFDQSNDLPYDMAWEFPRERLTFIKTLGSGAFGQVWLAEAEGLHSFKPRVNTPDARKRRKSIQKSRRYHSMSFRYRKQGQLQEVSLEKMMVAVKTLKDGAAESEYKDLASELKILIHLGEHKNIVNLLGACTTNGKLCVILECCPHGSLLNFLRNKRDIFQSIWAKYETDMEKECTYIDLAMIAWQVAKGMDFLQSKKLVHRDLASRNVLVGDDFVMKIADFGLARDIYKDEFYLKQTNGLLPVKWMAPESLFDKVYTTSSDVWSYGILLWEIFTLGGSPYPGLPTEDLFSFLEDGKRMDCPDRCPKDIYEIMSDCWAKSPYERPLFAQVAERLNNVMKQNIPSGDTSQYLDFTDGNKQDDYLQPQKPQTPSEYLQASGLDDMPLKDDHSKPLLDRNTNDYEDDFDGPIVNNSPLPPPPPPDDYPNGRYIQHDPDEHYKVPKSNFEIV